MQAVTLLGATGSIGENTLDVISRHPDRYRVFAITAHRNSDKLLQQIKSCQPEFAVLSGLDGDRELVEQAKKHSPDTELLFGKKALQDVAEHNDVDIVMAAIVGAAGLLPTLSAAQAGKKVLLANKEALVVAGDLFMKTVKESGATLLPIDSEHNAIFQCLPKAFYKEGQGVQKVLLTGSGGPFRETPLTELPNMTPEQACAHPNWDMGKKISVDSATMMNKGLEVIEACHLFGISTDQLDVVLHPQSIIHSMVSYVDGSVLAQMGQPDMRTPIAYGLAWPERIDAGVEPLDFFKVSQLDFDKPDFKRYPCLKLAFDAYESGNGKPAILNAANEISVDAFLNNAIRFTDIARINEQTLEQLDLTESLSLDSLLVLDQQARRLAANLIEKL